MGSFLKKVNDRPPYPSPSASKNRPGLTTTILLETPVTTPPVVDVMVYSSLPVFMALLDAAKTTLLDVAVTYPKGIPGVLAVVSVDVPGGGLEIVNENGSYT
jgi:hypothetical protein